MEIIFLMIIFGVVIFLQAANHKRIRLHEYFKDRHVFFIHRYLRMIYSNPEKFKDAPADVLRLLQKGRTIMNILFILVIVFFLIIPTVRIFLS